MGCILRANVKGLELFIDNYMNCEEEMVCTIMAYGGCDRGNQILINILAYWPWGTAFMKLVDATDMVKTTDNLFHLFKEVVMENVVQFMIDNEANYKAARERLEEFWCMIDPKTLILNSES